MKAAIYTTDVDDRGRQVTFAHDPTLTAALQPHYPYPVDAMTYGYGPREAAWMLEDLRVCWVCNMLDENIPVPDDYQEYIEQARARRWHPMRRWTRPWSNIRFQLMRLPYALRDAAERRALRRMAK